MSRTGSPAGPPGAEIDWRRLRPAAPGAAPVGLDALPVWVFTDLHLAESAPDEVRAFAESLAAAPPELGALVVLGDLFDAWVGPEQWREETFRPLAEALRGLAGRGVRVLLLRGNRDVMLEPAHGAAVGGEVADAVLLDLGAHTWLLTHGDQFCLLDRPYQRLRRWLRRPWLRALARHSPHALRRWAAGRLRSTSQAALARKPLDTLALVDEAVEAEMERHGASRALIGHLHVAGERRLAGDRRLRILPAWEPGTGPVVLGAGLADSEQVSRI